MKNIVRIGNGQGFWGDSVDAPIKLAKEGALDYLTLDYLAEVTLSIMQRQKNKNPKLGYAQDFIDLISNILPEIHENNLKVITNAGGVNPEECRAKIIELFKNHNQKIKVGIISGDDILSKIHDFHKKGISFENMDTGMPFDTISDKIYSANVYIDSYTIAKALDLDAQIVLAGRVTDPGLALGPCIHEYGWNKTDYDLLAAGTLAGHIIECGAQCTGGNYTKWKDVPNMDNIGYPIIEMNNNGHFSIKKAKNTGGLINRETISEQILYEMGNPRNYISPDVCVDFTSFKLIEKEHNEVKIIDTKGYSPTGTYKVSISYFAGYKSSGQLTISGPDALDKAKLTAEIIWKRLSNVGIKYDDTLTEYLGISSCHGNINQIPDQINEVVLRLSVKDQNKQNVARFGKEISPVITSGPPGITGYSSGRPKPQEIIAYWPTLIPKDLVQTNINVI